MQENRNPENTAMRALYAFAILFVVDGHLPLADLFDFGGLYRVYHRCSCWCCPFQRIDELRRLRLYHPELWRKLLELDQRVYQQFGDSPLGKFKQNWRVTQLEERFARENAQQKAGVLFH